jgi:hypothetical protein
MTQSLSKRWQRELNGSARLMNTTSKLIPRKNGTNMEEILEKEVETTLKVRRVTTNASKEEKNEKLTIMYYLLK